MLEPFNASLYSKNAHVTQVVFVSACTHTHLSEHAGVVDESEPSTLAETASNVRVHVVVLPVHVLSVSISRAIYNNFGVNGLISEASLLPYHLCQYA